MCVSFFPSLSECLFLDRFEGQGLATGGEKAVFPFKREAKKKKKETERREREELSLPLHNEKKTERTSSS